MASLRFSWLALAFLVVATSLCGAQGTPQAFFETHCYECHDADVKKGDFDLTALPHTFTDAADFDRWVKVFDRIDSGEMPPAKKPRPLAEEKAALLGWLKPSLVAGEQTRLADEGRTGIRRLTRVEYENTVRDLFDMPGIALRSELPADGSAHGFDKNSDALDISHVNLAKYIEAADHVLDLAIATQPKPPTVQKRRISLANRGGFVAHIIMNGDGVLLKDQRPDPEFPPASEHRHIDQGAHESMGSFRNGASVGLFRHEDESVSPYFMEHVTIYPGRYRVRTSLWSFQWDKGEVLPARGTEAARLSVVQLTGDGRGGQHPSYVLGFFDAPSLEPQEHELITWLNHNELIGFNTASLAPVANYNRKGRSMAFTGPGITVDWLDVEGPLHDVWPPLAHQVLFDDLPLSELQETERPPVRKRVRQLGAGQNRPDPDQGLWTVASEQPLIDADRLLATFLPKAFRRPVPEEIRKSYLVQVEKRLSAGDCFETAMRWAYRAALCSPDFLYLAEPTGALDDHALASRISYFLWNSTPDAHLTELAASGSLREPETLRQEISRLLADAKSNRFVTDFLGQWLALRNIASTDPDKKLYPEFSTYLQNSMVAETEAFFREVIDKDLDATHLIDSDFAMLNEKLAVHYGIEGVTGSQIRRVNLPVDSPRGGFLTQGAILKITANGTTTSPVPRGAFVLDRLLGTPPDPPPPNIPAVEPDVQGATTIRALLDKHRADPSCAGCHAKLDPPGFALEAFDVIGGFRDRYRSLGEGDPVERGSIDPFIGISFKHGPPVDASGTFADGRAFSDVVELQKLLTKDATPLLRNLARQLAVYSTGRPISFSDRDQIAAIVSATEKKGGGLRTLIHELIQSPLFQTR
jgi:mono/diheme cytochrome c family protein